MNGRWNGERIAGTMRHKKLLIEKNLNSLQNLPLGAKITVQKRGQSIVLEKGRISNRKNPVWISRAENVYYPLSHIKRYGYTLCNPD